VDSPSIFEDAAAVAALSMRALYWFGVGARALRTVENWRRVKSLSIVGSLVVSVGIVVVFI
jgi:hypothetical protein